MQVSSLKSFKYSNVSQEVWHDSVDERSLPEPIQIFDCSTQGFGYICGFLAMKLGSKYPHIGSKSSDTDINKNDICTPWIKHLSNGGLYVPSDVFVAACSEFEKKFASFNSGHKNGIDQDPNVIERMKNVLVSSFPSWPEEILLLFVKTRMFIRIKYLNSKLMSDEGKARRRQLKQIGQFEG